MQFLKTTMFNELEVKTKTPTEFDEVVQKCKDMFAGFENTLANIETKMGGGKKGGIARLQKVFKKTKRKEEKRSFGKD